MADDTPNRLLGLRCECGHNRVQHCALHGCLLCVCKLTPEDIGNKVQRAHTYPPNSPHYKQDVWSAWVVHHIETGHTNLDSDDEYGITCRECDKEFFSEEFSDDESPEDDEAVNHPAHYGGDTTYEVIKVTDAWLTPEENLGAMKFQVIKYVARAGKKDPSKLVQDLEKTRWYLDRAIALARASGE